MSGLPQMIYGDGIRKAQTLQFGGYNHNLYAGDGQIWDMENMTSDYAPLLSPRKPRYKVAKLNKPNGFYGKDGMYWVDGTTFYAGGTDKGTVTDSEKTFCALGAYIIILPDKKMYHTINGTFENIEKTWTGAATIKDGSYVGEAAKANTIYAQDVNWSEYFKVGDAVTISGAVKHPENNRTPIIREIDGGELRFYENVFVINEGGDAETLTIERTMPDLDFICENENRLWGCKGDTIYASKLGDPTNWNVYDGLSTDSYAVNVGSAGDFTACTSYLGYPVFFKEEIIYKVFGDKPSNFQVMSSASLGVERGSAKSIAIAGETLYYNSRAGIMAYSGGIPSPMGAAFGTVRYKDAVGGSDGRKYYVSMKNDQGRYTIFAYDTWTNLWHKEDYKEVINYGWNEELYFLDADGNLWLSGNTREVPDGAEKEAPVNSIVEFGDFTESDANKKGTAKLQLRIEVDADSEVQVQMMFDTDGEWVPVSTLVTKVKRSYYLPIIPRRSDHFKIRLVGVGGWRLYSLVRENYSGSELRSTK